MTRDYLRELLGEMPPFLALLRARECALYEGLQPWEEPVLDVGLGDGRFARAAWRVPPLAGIDPDINVLRTSRGACRCGIAADATALPFAPGSFRTIVSNSVLEHIPDMESALREITRVLAPGGRLCFTTPSRHFGDMLLGSTLWRGYGRWFNRHSRHFHTDDPDTWLRRLAALGLRVEEWRYFSHPAAHCVFDVAHYFSVPNLIIYRATGRWVLRRGSLVQRLWERALRGYVERDCAGEGPYLFFDARKDALR